MAGPIEFLSDRVVEQLGDTEYGGGPGLIERAVDPLGGVGHVMTESERSSALRRAGNALAGRIHEALLTTGTLEERDAAIAAALDSGVVDPVSGREDGSDPDGPWSVDGASGLSDLKP